MATRYSIFIVFLYYMDTMWCWRKNVIFLGSMTVKVKGVEVKVKGVAVNEKWYIQCATHDSIVFEFTWNHSFIIFIGMFNLEIFAWQCI